MSGKSKIEWTDATWNPIVGCSLVSPACTNCYAMAQAHRIQRMKPGSHYEDTTKVVNRKPVWTGVLKQAPEHILTVPLRWKKPRRIFVNSMSDLFHERVPDEWIDRIFAVMALCPQHTLQVLTKRAPRMREYLSDPRAPRRIYEMACDLAVNLRLNVVLIAPGFDAETAPPGPRVFLGVWPLPNVWIGVTAEDQRRADERIPELLATPAAVRFVSCEPLLGEVDFGTAWAGESALDPECWGDCAWCEKGFPPLYNCRRGRQTEAGFDKGRSGLDLVIAGGESGPDARPMHPDWARSLRDQCAATGVAFFMKQMSGKTKAERSAIPDDMQIKEYPDAR